MESGASGSPEGMPLTAAKPRTVSLVLPPLPESARRARRALVQAGLDPDLDHTVSLLATELVTNSVRHVEGVDEVRLEATLTDGFARVEVMDSGPGFDPDVRHDVDGFGLRLVDKLASRWGVDRADGSTKVWFEVDRRRRRFERDNPR
jgi:two-component sensor histidine kinase